MAAGFPTPTIIVNGGRGYRRYGRNVTQVFAVGDGSSGQWTDKVLIDLSQSIIEGGTSSYAAPYPTGMKIFRISGWVDGTCTNIDLEWDFATDIKVCSFISPNEKNHVKFPVGLKSPTSELWDDCETTWTATTNVTAADETTIKRFGTKSQKLTTAAAFTTGKIGYITGESTSADEWDGVSFYIYSSVALQPNDLSFAIDDSGVLASPTDYLKIPFAMDAGTWYFAKLYFNGPATASAIVSHGLWAHRDFGAANLYIDNVRFIKRSQKFPSGDSGTNNTTAYGDLVCTTLGAVSADELYIDIESEFTYSEDSIRS